MKILITGGAGYIGSRLTSLLLAQGYKVSVIDNLMYRQNSLLDHFSNPNFNFFYGDIRDQYIMKKLLVNHDVVIPLAAIVGAPACDKNPILATEVNVNSLRFLFDNISKGQLILMPTTNSAYGTSIADNLCTEESPLNPISKYARDKVLVETWLQELDSFVSLRLATVFGVSERMRLDLLVNNFVFRAFTDRYLVLFEPNFRRNFIHISDVCRVFELVIQEPGKFIGQVFNVGLSSANLSKVQLAKQIQNYLPDLSIMISESGADPDKRDYLVSNQKIESLGFKPAKNLDNGISELLSAMPFFNERSFTNL